MRVWLKYGRITNYSLATRQKASSVIAVALHKTSNQVGGENGGAWSSHSQRVPLAGYTVKSHGEAKLLRNTISPFGPALQAGLTKTQKWHHQHCPIFRLQVLHSSALPYSLLCIAAAFINAT